MEWMEWMEWMERLNYVGNGEGGGLTHFVSDSSMYRATHRSSRSLSPKVTNISISMIPVAIRARYPTGSAGGTRFEN